MAAGVSPPLLCSSGLIGKNPAKGFADLLKSSLAEGIFYSPRASRRRTSGSSAGVAVSVILTVEREVLREGTIQASVRGAQFHWRTGDEQWTEGEIEFHTHTPNNVRKAKISQVGLKYSCMVGRRVTLDGFLLLVTGKGKVPTSSLQKMGTPLAGGASLPLSDLEVKPS